MVEAVKALVMKLPQLTDESATIYIGNLNDGFPQKKLTKESTTMIQSFLQQALVRLGPSVQVLAWLEQLPFIPQWLRPVRARARR